MRLIDADALTDRMYHEAFENDASYNESNPMARWDSGLWIRYKMFENAIDDAPTIEPKHGKWIWVEQILGLVCSECKELGVERSNFCPNCGADMRERKGE